MIRNNLRKFAGNFGYDIVKTNQYEVGKKYKRNSNDARFDFYVTPAGSYFFPKNCLSDDVANTIKKGLIFDLAILQEARKYIRPGTTVIDVGSNFGQMAIEFSRCAADVKVLALEAQDLIFQVLEKNIKVNNASNVAAIYGAVYDKAGVDMFFPEADLSKFDSYGSYGLDLSARSGKTVTSLTIDSLRFDQPVSFMKIDIQGSDLAAMRGSVNTIREHQMPIIFEYEEEFQQDFDTCFQDYLDFVNSIGYKFVKTIQDINYLIVPR